jgi:hypothetical protein
MLCWGLGLKVCSGFFLNSFWALDGMGLKSELDSGWISELEAGFRLGFSAEILAVCCVERLRPSCGLCVLAGAGVATVHSNLTLS